MENFYVSLLKDAQPLTEEDPPFGVEKCEPCLTANEAISLATQWSKTFFSKNNKLVIDVYRDGWPIGYLNPGENEIKKQSQSWM